MPEELLLPNTSSIESKNIKPRLGFLGVGWIGRNRMEVIANHGAVEITFISDTVPQNTEAALQAAPTAQSVNALADMLT